MTITTKFEPGEMIFFIKNSKITEAKIYSITIDTIKNEKVDIHYEIINSGKEYHTRDSGGRLFKEEWLFKTKQELIESL